MWSAADIVNTILAATGVAVGVVGLGFVLWQVRKARSAAEAASVAAREARSEMAQRLTTSEFGDVRADLRTVLEQLHGGQYESAWSTCQKVREQLVALKARPGLEELDEQLTQIITSLSEAQTELEREAHEDGASDVSVTIRSVVDTVVALQQHALFFREKGTASESHRD